MNKNNIEKMTNLEGKTPDFTKGDGLIPAIIQDATTDKVLMLGYMNEEAFLKTQAEKKVTFFSRSKQRLWTKGEESKNYLHVVDILLDCDNDTFLVKATPAGPTCHTGADTCWGEENVANLKFLEYLEDFLKERKRTMPEGSYTTKLFKKGVNKITQKVGEEAVEMIIDATNGTDENMIYEGADLMYHMLVLLVHKGYGLNDLVTELKKRHK